MSTGADPVISQGWLINTLILTQNIQPLIQGDRPYTLVLDIMRSLMHHLTLHDIEWSGDGKPGSLVVGDTDVHWEEDNCIL